MKTEGLVTKAQGLDFLRVVGKGMDHKVDKDSAKLMKEFHDVRAEKGTDPFPSQDPLRHLYAQVQPRRLADDQAVGGALPTGHDRSLG